MDIGIFFAHQLPDTPPSKGFDWDMQVTRWADEYRFSEVWHSEHFTLGYERWPSARAEQRDCGGFGTLLIYNFDCHAAPEVFRRHLELLATVVAPSLQTSMTELADAR